MVGALLSVNKIEVVQIGVVNRDSPEEDEFDRSLVSRIVLKNEFADGLKGVEEFSHVFIIYWLDRIPTLRSVWWSLREVRNSHSRWESSPRECQSAQILLV